MNPLMRFVSAAVALAAVCFVSGCATSTARAPRPKVTMEFAVVESSTEKELAPEQVADLRQAVADYLREQGLTDGRTYYVKVTFPSADPNEEPQWAVVRIGSQLERTYEVIAAYPGRDDSYPYELYPINYPYSSYSPGYYSFSNWSYYDPFDYNYGYYHRPTPPRKRDDGGKPDQPKKPGQPGQKPADRPPWDPTRWNHGPRPNPDEPRHDPGHPEDPNRWTRNHPTPRDDQSRFTPRPDRNDRPSNPTPVRSSSPQPERSYTPSPPSSERSNPSPANTSSSNSSRSDSSRTQPGSREQER